MTDGERIEKDGDRPIVGKTFLQIPDYSLYSDGSCYRVVMSDTVFRTEKSEWTDAGARYRIRVYLVRDRADRKLFVVDHTDNCYLTEKNALKNP